ncbi:MAG: hypothetical protein HZA14_10095 [Nitrospirae bacterium]|nr:hypothetical protein [Nitrospirota bacterium]
MVYASAFIMASCSSLLPSVKETTPSNYWKNFDEAKEAFEKIIPHVTTVRELHSLGFDPFSSPNVKIMTYLDVIQRSMANTTIKKEDLDEGIQKCISAKAGCSAYEIHLRSSFTKRYGNVFLDLFNFKRLSKESGWEFQAFIIIVEDTVVYKLWGGRPIIDESREVKNPLGPLQDPSDIIKSRAEGAVNF